MDWRRVFQTPEPVQPSLAQLTENLSYLKIPHTNAKKMHFYSSHHLQYYPRPELYIHNSRRGYPHVSIVQKGRQGKIVQGVKHKEADAGEGGVSSDR